VISLALHGWQPLPNPIRSSPVSRVGDSSLGLEGQILPCMEPLIPTNRSTSAGCFRRLSRPQRVGSEEARVSANLRPLLKLHVRFSRMQLSRRHLRETPTEGNTRVVPRRARQVDPGLQYPRTMRYGFFAKRTDPPHRPYSAGFPSRPFCLRPAAFPDPLRSHRSVTWFWPRFRYYSAVRRRAEPYSPLR
jgi:hypothetical protein